MKQFFLLGTGLNAPRHYPGRLLITALFSLIALAGFAQSGTIILNTSTTLPVSSATKFPIWLPGSSTASINIGSNVTSISGILYNITPSTAGGNIMTVNSVVYITGSTPIAAGTALKVEGILFTSTSGSAATAWNLGGNTAPSSTILGTTDGTSAVNLVAGTGGLNIGTDVAAKTIIIGTTSDVISENVGSGYTLNGIGASTYNIGAATTTGTISLGGTVQTGVITIGAGPGTPINIGGATSTTAIGHNATIAGTLGIGNSTPTYPLDVTGTGRFTTSLISPSHIFTNTTNGNTVTLQSGATTTSYPLTLPLAQGTNGQTLVNNGSGTLTWTSPTVACFSGQTINAPSIVAHTANYAEFTTIQNSDATVFQANTTANYGVTILKSGVIQWCYTQDILENTGNYAYVSSYINGTLYSNTLSYDQTAGIWTGLTNCGAYYVTPGTTLTFGFPSVANITAMDNTWGTLSVTWFGR
jgi:hypothetical protein